MLKKKQGKRNIKLQIESQKYGAGWLKEGTINSWPRGVEDVTNVDDD